VAAAALLLFFVLVGVDLATLGGGGGPQSVVPAPSAKEAFEAGQALSAAPAPTPVPAPPTIAADEESRGATTPEPTVGAATPTEAPATVEPPGAAKEGGDAGRWVLRGFQGAAGAVFLATIAALVWQRRRGRGVGRT
jgi:hypothetical protein